MRLLLQEKLYHLDTVYFNIHFDKHDVRVLKESDPLQPSLNDNDEKSPQAGRRTGQFRRPGLLPFEIKIKCQ